MKKKEDVLNARIAMLEAQLANIEIDRTAFREEFSSDLRWPIEMHGRHPTMSVYIEKKAKFLGKVQWWLW